VFVIEAANQALADQIAAGTGIRTVWTYHATQTDPGSPVPAYLDFMRENINAIVGALK
jgi:ABC-type Zn uptake system ZnuABC Zn-binding protein ZnuA